jgi:hypothetical protein
LFGKKLRGAKFVLTLRSAQTELSQWKRFFFVDLELEAGQSLASTAADVAAQAQADRDSGLDFTAMEAMMREGLGRAMGADAAEDGAEIAEFYDAGSFAYTRDAQHTPPLPALDEVATSTPSPVAKMGTGRVLWRTTPATRPAVDGDLGDVPDFAMDTTPRAPTVAPRSNEGIWVPGFSAPVTHDVAPAAVAAGAGSAAVFGDSVMVKSAHPGF